MAGIKAMLQAMPSDVFELAAEDENEAKLKARRACAIIVSEAGLGIRYQASVPHPLRGLSNEELGLLCLASCKVRSVLTMAPSNFAKHSDAALKSSVAHAYRVDATPHLVGSNLEKARTYDGARLGSGKIAYAIQEQLRAVRNDQAAAAGKMVAILTAPRFNKLERGLRPAKVLMALVFLLGYPTLPFKQVL